MNTVQLTKGAGNPHIDFSQQFTLGEGTVASYAWMQLTGTSALGTVSGSTGLIITLNTLGSLIIGSYIQIGSTDSVRVAGIDPFQSQVTLAESRVVNIGDAVSTRTVASGSPPAGTTFDTNLGIWNTDNPTATGSVSDQFVRLTDSTGLTADTDVFAINIVTPPVLVGVIPDQNIVQNPLVGIFQLDVSAFAAGADTYAISPLPPASWNTTPLPLLTIPILAAGDFGPFTITYSNAFGSIQSRAFLVHITAPVIVPPTGVAGNPLSPQIQMELTLNRLNQFGPAEAYGTCITSNADPVGFVYRLFRIPSGARITRLWLVNDANPSGSLYKIGLLTSPGGGLVLAGSDAVLCPSLSMDTARTGATNVFSPAIGGTAFSVSSVGLRVWELLGLSQDPSQYTLQDVLYDVAITVLNPGQGGGNVFLQASYLPAPPRGLATPVESPW